MLRFLSSALLVIVLVPLQASAGTGTYGDKQKAKYYSYRDYTYYSYKSKKNEKHKAIYYHSRPRYIYLYNPVTGKFWGRYDLVKEGYSLLADRFKSGSLNNIPESAFGPPGLMPPPEKGHPYRMNKPPEAK